MIVARVRRTIEERALIGSGERVLAACSGGADSGAMLFALARLAPELGFVLESASVDHRLREGSARDVEAARAQAARAGVRFHALAVTVPSGASLQAQARSARYDALLARAAEIGAARLAVAHTRDDQAETVLMRVLRGAGVGGLAGIQPRRDDGIVRPLIDCSRADVREFASAHCPTIAEDASNTDPRFERVRVRERVLPALLAEDPSIVDHLADLADDARALFEALDAPAAEALGRSRQGTETIDFSRLAPEATAVRQLVFRRWVRELTGEELGRSHLTQIERCLAGPAEVWLPGGWRLRVAAGGLARLERGPREP